MNKTEAIHTLISFAHCEGDLGCDNCPQDKDGSCEGCPDEDVAKEAIGILRGEII